MLEAALEWAAKGWAIFPVHTPLFAGDTVKCSCRNPDCKSIGKHPRTFNGFKDATTDTKQITEWWTQWPDANIGSVPGSVRLMAFDIDTESARKAAREMGLYSEPTFEVKTGNGEHRYFRVDNPPNNGATINGIIVRCGFGLIILPPSLHWKRVRYEIVDPSDPIPLPPDALALVGKAATKEGAKERVRHAMFAEELTEGERHANLLTFIGKLAASQLDEEAAIEVAMDRNIARCQPTPKPRAEVVDMVQYVYAKERQKYADVAKHLVIAHAPKSSLKLVTDTPQPKQTNPLEEPLPGILEDWVQWSLATAASPVRLYSVAAALSVASVICARRYTTDALNYSTLYILVVGYSGTGKEHARASSLRFLKTTGKDSLIGGHEFTSKAAVWANAYQRPQSLAILDEFGQFLAAASGGGDSAGMKNGVITGLMELYGRVAGTAVTPQYATLHHTAKQREDSDSKNIERPALSLLALTTPDEFYASLKSTRVTSGFLNRFLVIESNAEPGDIAFATDAQPPAALTDWALTILASKGTLDSLSNPLLAIPPDVLHFTDDARDMFTNFRRQCNARAVVLRKEKLGELPVRANEQAMRLSLISALARNPRATVVDDVDMAWGIRVAKYLLDQLIPAVQNRLADGETHALHNALLEELRSHGERGMTTKQLERARSLRNTRKNDKEYAIQWVQKAGYAEWKDVPHKGAGHPRFALVMRPIQAIEADNEAA